MSEGAAGLCQANAALCAREQLGAECPFELADGAAERGLGDVQPRGGPPEVQLIGHGEEVADEAQLGSNSHGLSIGCEWALDVNDNDP